MSTTRLRSTTKSSSTESPVISLEEVRQHKGEDGTYWTCINNEVYDITSFVAEHPGGAVLEIAAGRDGTDLFESYHPGTSMSKVEATLKTKVKHLGRLKETVPARDDKFFRTLRDRVEKHLEDKGLTRHSGELLGLFEISVTVVLHTLLSIYIGMYASYSAAVALGFVTGRIGFWMHMGNHAAVSSKSWVNRVVGGLMCYIGGSTFIWQREHQVAHHLSPNELHHDNDCQIGDPYIRMHPDLEWTWWHKFQTVTIMLGMSIGQFKWYVGDPFCLLSGQVGSVSFHPRTEDKVRMFCFKLQWFCLHVLLPVYYHGLSMNFVGPLVVFMVISAHYMQNIFIVNHIQQDLVPPTNLHWADRQTLGTCNWASGSVFWNFFSGGLNHQIEHHMFPSMHHYLYPEISPIVKRTCKEFGVTFANFDTFPQAWLAMIKYLHKLGAH